MKILSRFVAKAVLGAAMGAVALGSLAQAQELPEVKVITPNDQSCGQYPQHNGTAFGFYQDSGVKVTLLPSNTTVPYVAFLQNGDADLVMLSGDSHNAWAYSLAEDGRPAGVEFAGHSVTSGGIEGDCAADPKTVAAGFIAANPELKWADTSRRGYMMIEVTPQRVTGEWLFLQTIQSRTTAIAGTHRMHVERGRRAFA